MRAIDADKLKEVLEKNFGHTGGASVLVQLIDIQDTIQPKRGKWILKTYRWECDQCGCLIRRANPFKGNIWNYNYCPNCGADMRGEQDG